MEILKNLWKELFRDKNKERENYEVRVKLSNQTYNIIEPLKRRGYLIGNQYTLERNIEEELSIIVLVLEAIKQETGLISYVINRLGIRLYGKGGQGWLNELKQVVDAKITERYIKKVVGETFERKGNKYEEIYVLKPDKFLNLPDIKDVKYDLQLLEDIIDGLGKETGEYRYQKSEMVYPYYELTRTK